MEKERDQNVGHDVRHESVNNRGKRVAHIN